jgi:hypothetical protein
MAKIHISKVLIFIYFQTPPFEEKTCLGKNLTFWSSFFLGTGWTNHLQISHGLRSGFYLSTDTKKDRFPWMPCHFDTTPISRLLGGPRNVLDRIQQKSASFWISVDGYVLYRVA